jgi:D-3-phosphoglycerate dehydrogenase
MARIVRTDRELEMARVDATLRRGRARGRVLPDGVSEATLCDAVRDAGLILMCYTPITQRVIDAAPRLKGIVKYGVGIDAIDIEAAKARGIPVVNVPEYAEETVAEGAMTLMLALAKKLKPIQRAMDGKGWAWPESRWIGLDLSGRTLGVIGLGRIGSKVARMAGRVSGCGCWATARTPMRRGLPTRASSGAPTLSRLQRKAIFFQCIAC